MIPKLIHHIWLGPRPVPQEWANAWATMHPDWETRVWREDDLAKLPMRNEALYRRLLDEGAWVAAADVARLEILHHLGGFYTDIDSVPVRPLDGAWFLEADVFAAYEPIQEALPGRIANGSIGAMPQAEAIDEARGLVGRMRVTDPPWATIGAPALTAALIVHERCCHIEVLPSKVFFRKDARGRAVAGDEESYVEHFWSSTNRTYPTRVVVLVPRRAGDPVRDANWEWCRRIWEQQGWPIFEGHHDDPGLFNASVARNRAAAAAGDWDVAVFADADTVPHDWRPVHQAVALAAKSSRFVRPFDSYYMLDEAASRAFMASGVLPRSGMRRLGESAYGGIHVVGRRLWDLSGGYDERFLGWGSEDAAFEFACRALGGFVRLSGSVYHLWHPMQPRDPSTPQFQANVALGARYRAAQHHRRRIQALIRERSEPQPEPEPPRVGAVVVTNGRRELIARTIASLEERVKPLGSERVICDDSGDRAYAEWLRGEFPAWRIEAHRHLGHGGAVAFAWRQAVGLKADWVFWSEDDYTFERDIDLTAIARVMEAHPDVSQMVIRRQAWFPAEVEAGGMIDRFDPAAFTQHEDPPWLEHQLFYSLNPHLARPGFMRRNPWPAVANSEHRFGRRVLRGRVTSGIWGRREDPPWAIHAGERTGTGY